MNPRTVQEAARRVGKSAAIARLFKRYMARLVPRIVYGPNPHHAGGRARTSGIPWARRKR